MDSGTEEGLVVTVLEFKSDGDAGAYLAQTRPSTLSYAAATVKPFHDVPGAFEADGTKPYDHGYYHAIFGAANNFYYQLAYATPYPSPAVVELGSWANLQYRVLEAS